MDKDQERSEKYKSLNETLQNLYGSPEAGTFMYSIFKRFLLEEVMYAVYAQIVGDCILGFYKTTDLPRLFQQKLQLSADEAQRLTSSLTEFLRPVIHRETVEAEAKRQKLTSLATTLQNPSPDRLVNPDIETATENVTPLRTMEKDMNRIHGYGAYRAQEDGGVENDVEEGIVKSSQEDILPRKPDNLS